jgi:hypothetical protein
MERTLFSGAVVKFQWHEGCSEAGCAKMRRGNRKAGAVIVFSNKLYRFELDGPKRAAGRGCAGLYELRHESKPDRV